MPPLPQSARIDLDSIRRSVGLFLPPDTVTELRVPKSGNGVMSGYFSDPKLLTDAILEVNNKVPGIYVTLNPVPPDALARSSNHLTRNALTGTGTKDSEILHRNWLLIDFDPVRLRGISSTDTEHEESIATAQIARDALASENWPAPALGDSGNGGHLLYAIDLPNDQESADLIRAVLQASAQRWSTPRTKVDTTVFNASRISKVYGTFVKKGDSTVERPHRVSRLLDVPSPIISVPLNLLRALAAEVRITPPPAAPSTRTNTTAFSAPFDMSGFIQRHALTIKSGPEPWEGGALRWVLECCPFNPEHRAKDAAIFLQAGGRPGFKCFHDSCADNHWPEFRRLYETPRARANDHATNGFPSPATAPLASPFAAEDTTAASREVEKYNAVQAAETLLDEVIKAKKIDGVYGTIAGPPAYLTALANCPQSAHERAKARLDEAFKDFAPRRWAIELKEEIAKAEQSGQTVVHVPRDGWESELILSKTFQPAPCVTNALLYLDHHPSWAGCLAWNEFTGEPLVKKDLPFPINLKAGDAVKDHHDTLVQSWLERETGDPNWKIDTVRRSVDCWTKAHSFHPIKDYLNGLPKWDGVPRLKSWLATYCAAGPAEGDESRDASTLHSFIGEIGERWWISAIARIFEPGCKVHHVLVLEGAKGIGKTTLAEIIFGEYYAVILGDVSSKDNQALLSAGVWGVLMDELDVFGKSEMRSIKSWVTRDFEKFRPTWGYRHEKRPRQCVFIASVNGDDWALEEDRRWWPVACRGDFDLDGLRAARNILMAEALARYRAGQRWYFHAEEDAHLIETAKKEQAARVPDNVNAESFLASARKCALTSNEFPLTCSVGEVLEDLKIPLDRRTVLQVQCGKVLVSNGWTLEKPRGGDGRQKRRYRRPETFA